MALNDSADPNLHTIKTKLYEHHFENAEGGKYIARTINERTLSLEDIVDDMLTLDSHGGSRDSILHTLHSFIRTKMFRLADGYAVADGLTISYPQVTGTFNAPNDPIDKAKNEVVFKHVNSKQSRELAKRVNIEIVEIARMTGQIFYLKDAEEPDAPNNMYLAGNMVIISGEKIKIAGDNPACGVYFVPDGGAPEGRVKMTRIGENHAGTILGIAPVVQGRYSRIEIVTQFSGSGTPLKEPRVITGDFLIESM